jgi:hypothetical protein
VSPVRLLKPHPLEVPLKQRLTITHGGLADDPWLFEISLLFYLDDVLEIMSIHAQIQLELLYRAVQPFGEFKLGDVLFTGSAEDCIASGEAAQQAYHIKD